MRTISYIDGFNLYYTAVKDTGLRWLDLDALSRRFLSDTDTLDSIKYFTARVQARKDADQPKRQEVYLRALRAHIPILSTHFGRFSVNESFKAKLNPPIDGHTFWTVYKTEEKGSDVNLAVHLLNDAWEDRFDVALVFTNDSDLSEAIRLVRNKSKVVRVIVESRQRVSSMLAKEASSIHRFSRAMLQDCQLPDPVLGPKGARLTKPLSWR